MTFRGPSPAKHKGWNNGNPIYDIEGWKVVIRFDKPHEESSDGTLTAPAIEYDRDTRDRGTPLDVAIVNGDLQIPISAIVEHAIERSDPLDIVSHFWANEEVREAFAEALASAYSDGEWYGGGSHSFNGNRTKILQQMGCVLLDDRLNGLVAALQMAEYYQRRYEKIVKMMDWGGYGSSVELPERPGLLPPIVLASMDELRVAFPRLDGEDDETWNRRLNNRRQMLGPEDPDSRIGSKSYYESGHFWREKLIELWGLKPILEGGLVAIETNELDELRRKAALYDKLPPIVAVPAASIETWASDAPDRPRAACENSGDPQCKVCGATMHESCGRPAVQTAYELAHAKPLTPDDEIPF